MEGEKNMKDNSKKTCDRIMHLKPLKNQIQGTFSKRMDVFPVINIHHLLFLILTILYCIWLEIFVI